MRAAQLRPMASSTGPMLGGESSMTGVLRGTKQVICSTGTVECRPRVKGIWSLTWAMTVLACCTAWYV